MSNYEILPYSKQQAKKLGVSIQKSSNPKKKIDVFKNGNKIASIGAVGYQDYPHYLETDKKLAEQKRKHYKKRHQQNRNKEGSAGWYADKILW